MHASNYHSTSHLTLNPSHFPGGIAIWGALPAVFDTTNEGFDRGVHVHARMAAASKKAIDATYELVTVNSGNASYLIDEEAAVHFTMSSIFDIHITSLDCMQCGQPLISLGYAAVVPAHEHQCLHCNYLNITAIACVLNPIMALKNKLGDGMVQRPAQIPTRAINIELMDYPGGVQIWGSNPSILWTARRLEESAIHVHAYNQAGIRVVDNTYGSVTLAGEKLDIEMIRILQIQQTLPALISQLAVVACPACGELQFDRGQHAVVAHTARTCHACANAFSHQPVISNPAWQQLINAHEKFNHA
jgi:hypothetical protein